MSEKRVRTVALSAIIMLMLWYKGETKVENETQPVGKKSRFAGLKRYTRPKWLLVAAVVLCLLAIAIAWFSEWYKDYRINQKTESIPSETEFFNNRLAKLLASPPAANASEKERLKYYDDLKFTYADLGNYKKAVESHERRVAISDSGLDWRAYFYVASYYHKAGDDATALALLDKSASLVPPDNEDKAFYHQDALDAIEKTRKEYSS